jgi:predicted regulator of amino acid metabolism with ACT domain
MQQLKHVIKKHMENTNIKNVSHAYSYDAVETAIKQQHMKGIEKQVFRTSANSIQKNM